MRIHEPWLKAHLALWLVKRGAEDLVVSIDGNEREPAAVRGVFGDAGYAREPVTEKLAWTGVYTHDTQGSITVVSSPGADVLGTLPDKKRLVAECKGQPTPAGVKSGTDLTAFYQGLGQLIFVAGAMSATPDEMLFAVPKTPRFEKFVGIASGNRLVLQAGLRFALVDGAGDVTTSP
jgi:hypothetical protein